MSGSLYEVDLRCRVSYFEESVTWVTGVKIGREKKYVHGLRKTCTVGKPCTAEESVYCGERVNISQN